MTINSLKPRLSFSGSAEITRSRSAHYLPQILMWFVILGFFLAAAAPSFAAEPKLVAAFFVKGKVGLKWQKIDGVTDYSVYRKSSTGDWEKIATSDEDHYFDTDVVPGETYKYKVGIQDGGSEVFSAEKTVSIPGGDAGEFKPPTWVGIRMEQDKLYLNWDPVPTAIAYNILRSESPDGEFEVVGNAQTSKYADKGLEKGKTYYYKLTAMNAEFMETDASEVRSLKFGMSLEEQEALLAAQNKIDLVDVKITPLFDITEAGSQGPMNQPADIFINSEGRIYITDALNAKVHAFDPAGKHLFSFGEKMKDFDNPQPGGFQIPFTLFIDKKNEVYVTDINARDIQVFTADGKFIRRIRVDTGKDMKPFKSTGLHVLDDGRIITTDSENHRYLIISPEGKILFSKGERGDEPGQFNFPDELVLTADNTICIVDIINCRVQEFDMEGNFIRQFGSVGQSAGMFARPKAIAVDEQGWLWVADAMSHVIQGFTVEGEVKSALGTIDASVKFMTPRGMFFRDGKFYVVNRLHNRVAVYQIG